MTRHHLTLAALFLSATFAAQAQTTRPDDMPVKRPNPPQNSDRMLHNNPASDAIAK